MNGPDPTNKHPMAGFPRVCFIKNTISNPNIIVGDSSKRQGGSANPNLFPCPDCGRHVSRLAASCPNCGRPLASKAQN